MKYDMCGGVGVRRDALVAELGLPLYVSRVAGWEIACAALSTG
jgi:hypothetical protein